MLGLQLNNEVTAIQVLLEFLDRETRATTSEQQKLIQFSVAQISINIVCSIVLI